MKALAAALLSYCVLAGQESPQAAISYFTNMRNISIVQSDRQNYLVVDNDIWIHARPDLGDLRLYDGATQVQYSISEQRSRTVTEQLEARVLNLGSVSGHTEFDLDIGAVREYDRIRLGLDAKDFVVTASVVGMNALGQRPATQLPSSTLYDFTRENLGSNFTIKLPPSSFRYLHVKLSAGLRPEQIKGASIYDVREQEAAWVRAGGCGAPQQKGRETVMECDVLDKVPVNRIQFQIAPEQVNFLRAVRVENAKGAQIASGEIRSVRVTRAGSAVLDEKLYFDLFATPGKFTLTVENGDNGPLTILAAQALSLERRVYFDPQGRSALLLYYGDEKLPPPAYDYARFFHADATAAKAELGPPEANPEFAGRPDERPWSERHKGVLWAAMLLVVLGLGLLAIRGLRSAYQ